MKSNILIHQQQRVVPKTVGKNNKEGSPFPLDRKNNVMSILHTEREKYVLCIVFTFFQEYIHTKNTTKTNARVMMIRMNKYNKYNSTTTTHND